MLGLCKNQAETSDYENSMRWNTYGKIQMEIMHVMESYIWRDTYGDKIGLTRWDDWKIKYDGEYILLIVPS